MTSEPFLRFVSWIGVIGVLVGYFLSRLLDRAVVFDWANVIFFWLIVGINIKLRLGSIVLLNSAFFVLAVYGLMLHYGVI